MKIEYADGDVYEGYLLLGKYHGRGRLVYHGEKGHYDGDWIGGLCHGKGTRMYSNGNKYVGDFLAGEIDGNGIMFYMNGDKYCGKLEYIIDRV